MPFEFKEHDKGLFIRYFGFVAPSDYFDSRKAIASLPHQPAFEFVICDFTDMNTDCIWAMTRGISDTVGKRDAEIPRNQDALRKLALVSPSQKILDLLQVRDAGPPIGAFGSCHAGTPSPLRATTERTTNRADGSVPALTDGEEGVCVT